MEPLGDPQAVLVRDERGFLTQGTHSVGGHQSAALLDAWRRAGLEERFTRNSRGTYVFYGQTQHWYDLNGNLVQLLHWDGQTQTTFTYDYLRSGLA